VEYGAWGRWLVFPAVAPVSRDRLDCSHDVHTGARHESSSSFLWPLFPALVARSVLFRGMALAARITESAQVGPGVGAAISAGDDVVDVGGGPPTLTPWLFAKDLGADLSPVSAVVAFRCGVHSGPGPAAVLFTAGASR
jgi:hypothetical protein